MILFIKEYRLNKDITLRNLATLANCSHNYLSELENNKKRNPSLDVMNRLGRTLKICPIRLFGGCYGGYCNSKCYYYKSYYTLYFILIFMTS
ncbi:helix-turn-helix domain-containing protein [Clostridium sp. WILCCON 0269]|uniref:Helix-turn-helix domain-containing protein n=1 Tax=Candidatus Clostridium eludens TaxID=3381663 RepID=A0ABW8SRM9_9CLOT